MRTEIDNTIDVPGKRAPLVLNHDDFASVTRDICRVNEEPRPPKGMELFPAGGAA